jgi:hypothetical protein
LRAASSSCPIKYFSSQISSAGVQQDANDLAKSLARRNHQRRAPKHAVGVDIRAVRDALADPINLGVARYLVQR